MALNEFEKLCQKLNEFKEPEQDNLYVYAEKALKDYIGTDRKKFLQLKAQAEGTEFYAYSAFLLATAALVISLVDIILYVPNNEILDNIATLAKVFLLGWMTIYTLWKVWKYNHILKWRKYILVALAEIDKSFE